MFQKDFLEKCFILKCHRKDLKILGNSRAQFEITMNSRFRLENIKILLQSYKMRIRENKCKGRRINYYFPHNMQQ